jgi:CheY-like chemotaxis protein
VWLSLGLSLPNPVNCVDDALALNDFDALDTDFVIPSLRVEVMLSKRILVIDDEDVIQEVVQGCFEDVAGWEVLLASSGREGLEQVVTEQPDAIVLDEMMPGMDGIAFLKQLRASDHNPSIPVVLLTAKVDLADPKLLRELGVVDAIAKPFDAIALVERVAEVLGWTVAAEP